MKRYLFLVGFSMMLSVSVACGDDDDDDDGFRHSSCPELCSAAQAASCTVVNCDCNQFCTSLEAFKNKGGCGPTAEAYEDCALKQEACSVESNCGSQQADFEGCVVQFCAANPNDPDCQFLATC